MTLVDENGQKHGIIRNNTHTTWYFHGKIHRLDGPAVEWADGIKEWWVNDEFIMNEVYYSDRRFIIHVISFLLLCDTDSANYIYDLLSVHNK